MSKERDSGKIVLRRHHDMGGLPAGPVERNEHDYAPWEKRVDAILRLLSDKKRRIITVDELRRGIEELGPGAYDEMSYYERWIASVTNNLIEKGVITVDELGRRMAEVRASWPAGGADAPGKATPGKATPGKATPGKAAPGKTTAEDKP